MTTFTATNHQNKGRPYIDALLDSGYDWRETRQQVDLLLIDHDAPILGYRELIAFHRDNGAKIVVLPHGANPNLQWDGIWEPQPVDACIVPAIGHKEIMEAYGYPYPIHVLGWPWTPLRVPTAKDGTRVLFAPIHPDGSDFLPEPEKDANRRVFDALLTMGFDLTVRYLGSLAANGLPLVASATYNPGVYDNTHHDILNADVVVSSGTYGYLSIALGVPTVMYFQELGTLETATGQPQHYAEYKARLDYPIDALVMGTTQAVMVARRWDSPALNWRARFIGQAFDPAAFLDLMDATLGTSMNTVDMGIFESGANS